VHGVGLTSLWVAAMRAVETERPDGLFRDPFARRLAGEAGFEVMARGDPPSAVRPPIVAVRTRFIDETVRAALDAGTRQLVLVAAGMDSRAFRLEFPAGCRVFEIDQPEVLDDKAAKLGDATPRCERITVPVDLREDWPAALRAAGLDRAAPAFWLLEGLLPCLLAPDVDRLLARVSELAAPGSEVVFDVASKAVLASPLMKERLEFVASLGAPWHFSTDTPEALLGPLGWDVDVVDPGVIGNQHGRWPFPLFPRGTPGVPQSFLVHGRKRPLEQPGPSDR
jgi:methyltransferase (TIGR00027 family)